MGLWGIPQLLVVALQVVCAVHVLRTKRDYWWLFAIFCFPGVGALVYFICEIYPHMRRHGVAGLVPGGAVSLRSDRKPSKRVLAQLEEDLSYSETVDNRKKLADAYLRAGMAERAADTYRPCLEGLHKDDPGILWGFARAVFHTDAFADTLEVLDALDATGGRDYTAERQLLRARALEELGRTEAALAIYEPLAEAFSGEEARCRYGLLLQRSGRNEDALNAFRQTLARKRRSSGVYRSREREWFRLATRQIRQLQSQRDRA